MDESAAVTGYCTIYELMRRHKEGAKNVLTKGKSIDVRAGSHVGDKRRTHRPWNCGVSAGVLVQAKDATSYRCLSNSGSGRFADCFQTSWELAVSDPGDPVVMYAVIEGESDNPSPMG